MASIQILHHTDSGVTNIAELPLYSTPEAEPISLDRAALLEKTVKTFGDALVQGEWAVARMFYPDEFKAKCSTVDYGILMTSVWSLSGYPEDSAFVFERVTVEGDYGWAIGTYLEKDGIRIPFDNDEKPDFIWQDGRWVWAVSAEELAKENPCILDSATEVPTTAGSEADATDGHRGHLPPTEDRHAGFRTQGVSLSAQRP